MSEGALTGLEKKALRKEFEHEIMEAFSTYGPDFDKAPLIRKYVEKGLNQSSVYRWFERIKASGAPGREFAKNAREEAARRQAAPETARPISAEIVEQLPVVPAADDVVGIGVGPMVTQLELCINTARRLLKQSEGEGGKIRNARQAMAASEHLRRCVDTMARLTETLIACQNVEDFHKACIDVISSENPEAAQKIILRLRQMNMSRRGGPGA